MMRAYEIQNAFGLENLQLAQREVPAVGPGQVLLKMRACSLNYRDLLMVQGHYNARQPLPLVPLSDGVGEVVEIGDNVTRVKVGDRVAGCFMQGWIEGTMDRRKAKTSLGGPLPGMLQEYVVLSEHGVVHVPNHLNDVEAASLPCAAVTAWHALMVSGQVQPGQTVLLQGTGGVSLFALQMAKLADAHVIITSSSNEKLQRARELGADETINYREVPEWGRRVKELTADEGVDHVIEVGGAGTLAQSMTAVRTAGHIALIGILTGGNSQVNPIPLLMQNIRLQGIYVGSRAMFESMNRAITATNLCPVVDRIFDLADAVAAFKYLESAAHFGKVAIRF